MKGRTVALFVLVALTLAIAFAPGCKLLKRPLGSPPTEQSLRDAADKYFLDSGCQKIGDWQYQATESSGTLHTVVLQMEPARIIKYDNSAYPWQGILSAKYVTKWRDKEETKDAPFIMYWNAKTGAWEHLFGSDIPQPGGHK
jgi:hypothetical protein